jgi:hypothetical protein
MRYFISNFLRDDAIAALRGLAGTLDERAWFD